MMLLSRTLVPLSDIGLDFFTATREPVKRASLTLPSAVY
jgi:hypothetical protein